MNEIEVSNILSTTGRKAQSFSASTFWDSIEETTGDDKTASKTAIAGVSITQNIVMSGMPPDITRVQVTRSLYCMLLMMAQVVPSCYHIQYINVPCCIGIHCQISRGVSAGSFGFATEVGYLLLPGSAFCLHCLSVPASLILLISCDHTAMVLIQIRGDNPSYYSSNPMTTTIVK